MYQKKPRKTKKVAKYFPGHNNLLRYKKQGMKFFCEGCNTEKVHIIMKYMSKGIGIYAPLRGGYGYKGQDASIFRLLRRRDREESCKIVKTQ
jgi:hypothetical protein